MARNFRNIIANILLSRWSIVPFNLLIAVTMTHTPVEIVSLLWGAGHPGHDTIEKTAKLIEGMGVILIDWGVVLEERHGVSHLLGGLPSENLNDESAIDALCHHSGLALLVLGLVAEILVQCVEVPNHIINTDRLERVVLSGGAALLALGLAVMVRHSANLVAFRGAATTLAVAATPSRDQV
jgi:hypothetical protein